LLSPKQILQKYWGYTSFRDPQEAVINSVLQSKDVIAVLPTGSGKSIIYQVAGLALDGITLVISPLIALMEDQQANLNRRGVKSIALTGSLSFPEQERLLNNVQYGNTKFLFLSPERLQNDYIRRRLSTMPVKLITVDEAHCISEWGHDFRPSYTQIHQLREILPEIPVLALTATANTQVIKDIEIYLELKRPEIYRTSVVRNNIAYKVVDSEQKLNTLIRHLQKDTTAIVYVNTRKKTYQYAQLVAQHGFKTGFFHGGMTLEQKQQTLEAWLQDDLRVIFATTAFGMGIDKPDVRQVFHLDLPTSLENYVQESGRAGRDGNLSEATIIVDEQDTLYFEQNYLSRIPDIEQIQKVYKSLYNHFYIAEFEGKDFEADLNFLDFCRRFNLDVYRTLQSFQILEAEEIIKTFQRHQFYPTVRILSSPEAIRQYTRQQRYAHQTLNYLIRKYTDILYLDTPVKPDVIAYHLETSKEKVLAELQELHRREIIAYQPPGDIFKVLFLEAYDQNSFAYHQNRIAKRLKIKQKQLKEVFRYIQNERLCRSAFIARYFGEEEISGCGICDICQREKHNEKPIEIKQQILEKLASGCLNREELQKLFSSDIASVLDMLIENGKIYLSDDFEYCLKE